LSTTYTHGVEISQAGALVPPTSNKLAITPGAEVMCDPQGNLSLEAAQTGTYRPLEVDLATSPECRGYWVRFTLRTGDGTAGEWALQLSREWAYADLYILENGTVTVAHSGNVLAPQFRSLPSGDIAFRLNLANDLPRTIYLHVWGDTSRFGESGSLGASIGPLTEWILHQRSLLFGQGVYAGIILCLALYNLILFSIIRERVYLYYVIYVVSFGGLWIARTGFFFQYLWSQHHLWDWNSQPYLAASAIIFSVLFVRKFLAIREHSRPADWLLSGAAAVTLVLCIAHLFDVRIPFPLPLALIGMTITVFYAALGLVTLMRGYRPARFFLLAWAALLAGNAIYILMFLRVLPTTFFTYYSAQTGSALEGILLAFALADRVMLVERQKDARQTQYTRELQEKVQERTAALSDAVQQLQTASVTDSLTGLSNRRHVESAVQPWIAELQRERIRGLHGSPVRCLAICLADLDHFKLINDQLGHAAGDRALRTAAGILQQNVRATAMLARWGGEEFLILDHVTGPQEDLLMAERLRQSLLQDSSLISLETSRALSLSLGMVRYPFSETFPDLLDWDQCLALADHSLYRAKRAGRNRWQCYRCNETSLRQAVQNRGRDEVRGLLGLHSDEAFSLGLIEIIEEIPFGVEVG
jgi:diguanylate cyclase (GGDEF)-like protein